MSNTSPPSTKVDEKKKKFSGEAIAGIVLGLILVVGVIVGGVLLYQHQGKGKEKEKEKVSNRWQAVSERRAGESDSQWSERIYRSFLVNSPSDFVIGGGVTTNSVQLEGKSKLIKSVADKLCINPCFWSRAQKEKWSPFVSNINGMCNCVYGEDGNANQSTSAFI